MSIRMPGVVLAGGVDPLAVEPEQAVKGNTDPHKEERPGSESSKRVRRQSTPEAKREDDDEQSSQVRPDLVVEPGA